jgi:hypothetical protein
LLLLTASSVALAFQALAVCEGGLAVGRAVA